MIFVLASIQVRPGKLPAFLERFKANVPNVINEDGCIEYIPTIDLDAKLNWQVLDENTQTLPRTSHTVPKSMLMNVSHRMKINSSRSISSKSRPSLRRALPGGNSQPIPRRTPLYITHPPCKEPGLDDDKGCRHSN